MLKIIKEDGRFSRSKGKWKYSGYYNPRNRTDYLGRSNTYINSCIRHNYQIKNVNGEVYEIRTR